MKKYGGYIRKPIGAYNIYKEIVIYFAIKNIVDFLKINNKMETQPFFDNIKSLYSEKVFDKWWNLGGQLVSNDDLENLKNDIKNGILKNWKSIHDRYNELNEKYGKDKARYGLYALEKVYGKDINAFTIDDWAYVSKVAVNFSKFILESSIKSRKKDYTDPYRKMVYDNDKEMVAVLGNFKNISFLKDLESDTKLFISKIPSFLLL